MQQLNKLGRCFYAITGHAGIAACLCGQTGKANTHRRHIAIRADHPAPARWHDHLSKYSQEFQGGVTGAALPIPAMSLRETKGSWTYEINEL